MKIELNDFDGKIPNLALMRLSAYHKSRGDSVTLTHGETQPKLFDNPDLVYLSCIFRWNKSKALETASKFDSCIVGGTGVDILSDLPKEAKDFELDYSLYPEYRKALGFISRGCIRKCPWCVVPQKEGNLKRVATAKEIVVGKKKVVFLDNNFLAQPDYYKDLEWLAENNVAVDFNQGLDARLIDYHAALLLSKLKWFAGIKIALDSDGMIPAVEKAIKNMSDVGIRIGDVRVLTLIGFWGVESDVKRMIRVNELGAACRPMGYRENETGHEPAKGWSMDTYRNYRRIIFRVPHSKQVWEDFRKEML